MQGTTDKPRKVVMSRWEYVFICAMLYFASYANGRTGWSKLWKGPWWVLPLALAIWGAVCVRAYRRDQRVHRDRATFRLTVRALPRPQHEGKVLALVYDQGPGYGSL